MRQSLVDGKYNTNYLLLALLACFLVRLLVGLVAVELVLVLVSRSVVTEARQLGETLSLGSLCCRMVGFPDTDSMLLLLLPLS